MVIRTTKNRAVVAILLAHPTEAKEAAAAIAPSADVRAYSSAEELERAGGHIAVDAVLCNPRDGAGAPVEKPLRALAVSGVAARILVLVRSIPADLEVLARMADRHTHAIVRLAGQAPLHTVVRTLTDLHWKPEATMVVIQGVRQVMPMHPLLALAIVAGATRITVGRFATLCGVSHRSLERKLTAGGLPPAVRLLALTVLLHSSWRLEMDGVSVKQAAASAGFSSSEAFANFARRHLDRAPRDLSGAGAFRAVLATFIQRIRGCTLSECETATVPEDHVSLVREDFSVDA